MARYYYFENNNWIGAFEESEIRNFLSKGLISKGTLVKEENSSEERALDVVFSWASDEWSEDKPHPWRRYIAKAVDITFIYIVSLIIVMLFADDSDILKLSFYKPIWMAYFSDDIIAALSSRGDSIFEYPLITVYSMLLFIFIYFFITALSIGSTGKSIGKWLCGVQILNKDGNALGFSTALHREWMVFWRGLGLNIPIVNLFTQFKAYRALNSDGITSWDRDLETKVLYRKSGMKQNILFLIALIIFISF